MSPKLRPENRHRFLHGPYKTPAVRVGGRLDCLLRGRSLRVCGWSEGPTPWPLVRVGHGGRGALAMTPELARAVRRESEAAICRWLGVALATVTHWRKALGVQQFNEGTLKLYSMWKEEKLPDQAIPFSPAALRRMRMRRGLTCRQICRLAGWASNTSYDQMEKGRRRRATMPTLERLAAIFECSVADLLPNAGRKCRMPGRNIAP